MNEIIKMPRLGINDDYVVIGQWLVKNGDFVEEGQSIAVLETTKETSEMTAPSSGYIYIKANEDVDIAVEEEIAIIQEEKAAENQQVEEVVEQVVMRKVTVKAQQLINQHNIDIALLPTDQIIREKDVMKLIKQPYTVSKSLSNQALIYGAGGGCKIVIDILNRGHNYKVHGIFDRQYPNIEPVLGIEVIGSNNMAEMEKVFEQGYRNIINSVIFNGKKHGRKEPYEMLKSVGFNFINAIHQSAIIEATADIGEGNVIAAGAIIGSEATIGSNCFINAGSIISHDCIISDHCHIASGAILGGNVIVGENTLIGQGCTVYKDVKIGSNVVVVNGSHVFGNIPDNCIFDHGEISYV